MDVIRSVLATTGAARKVTVSMANAFVTLVTLVRTAARPCHVQAATLLRTKFAITKVSASTASASVTVASRETTAARRCPALTTALGMVNASKLNANVHTAGLMETWRIVPSPPIALISVTCVAYV